MSHYISVQMLHTLEKLLLLQELHLLVLLGESAREDGLGVEGDLSLQGGEVGQDGVHQGNVHAPDGIYYIRCKYFLQPLGIINIHT